MIIALKQKRIDAVCQTPNVDYIIEVKKRANTQAIGELETYEHLYNQLLLGSKRIQKVIVCLESDPDIEQVAKSHNIKIYAIGL